MRDPEVHLEILTSMIGTRNSSYPKCCGEQDQPRKSTKRRECGQDYNEENGIVPTWNSPPVNQKYGCFKKIQTLKKEMN